MFKARILNKSEEQKWDKFVESHPLGTIHQTSDWGHFQEKVPRRGKYFIVVLEDKGKIIGGSMIIRHGLPRNFCWFYSARGPLLDYKSKQITSQIQAVFDTLKPIAKRENAIFYRIDPAISVMGKLPKFKNAHSNHLGFQPEHTIILDLTKSENEILAQMKEKGRYNIRLAQKKGVTVRESDPKNSEQFEQDIEDFSKILHETTMRDKFYGHKKAFYRDMIKILYPKKAKLFLAEYTPKDLSKPQVIAGIVATFFKDTGTYYYGASGNEFRNVMAPYLLQWHAIKESKSRNLKYYDFLGISPPGAKNHPWRGVTDFKEKFGGKTLSVHAPKDFPFSKFWYLVFRIYKRIKG